MMKIIFTKTNSFAGLFIRLFTWSKWNHVAILDDDGNHVIHATAANGVCREPLSSLLSSVDDYEYASVSGNIELARNEIGKRYDWLAVLACRWGFWDNADQWFCSELAAMASGMFRQKSRRRVTPQHLYMVSKKL